MTQDLASLFRESADKCPAMPPRLVDEAIRRGQQLHRRRRLTVVAGAMGAAAAATAAVVLASGATGPGDEPPSPAPAGNPDDLPVVTEGDEIVVSCGDEQGWPVSVMAEGVPGLLDEAEATRTFQNIVDDPQWGGEAQLSLFKDGVDVEWRVLRGDDDSLVVGLGQWTDQGPAPRDTYVLDLERRDDRWIPTGWGGCPNLGPVLRKGHIWVQVHSYRAVGPEATELQALVSEATCTSARDPGPFLHEPTVIEEPDTVTVYWTSTPVEGGADCPGNPGVTRPLELDAPIGDRQLLDGSRYPAQPVEPDADANTAH